MPKSKKTARRADQKSSTETSTPSFEVELDLAFLESLRKRGRPQSQTIGNAMNAAAKSWGFPHQHAGVGIRQLRKNLLVLPGVLYFLKEASHDEVRAFLKNR
jgi:hypothetical protein